MPDETVSIVICTRNRAGSLARTLQCFQQVEPALDFSYEIIIVDNGSTDHTQAVMAEFERRLPLTGVIERRPGLAIARNAGLAAASGTLVLMTDDDCYVAANWVNTAVRLLRHDPLRLIGGRVELHDPEDLPLAIKTSLERQALGNFDGLIGFIHGANLAFGRELVDRIGLFDPRFGAGSKFRSAEDADFAYRAWRSGIPVVYEPDLLVHHHHGRRGREIWYRQVGEHAFGFGALAAKFAQAGDRDLLKVVWWDLVSTLKLWRQDFREWRRVRAKLHGIVGILVFLATGRRK